MIFLMCATAQLKQIKLYLPFSRYIKQHLRTKSPTVYSKEIKPSVFDLHHRSVVGTHTYTFMFL